jgi:hypothetical protein
MAEPAGRSRRMAAFGATSPLAAVAVKDRNPPEPTSGASKPSVRFDPLIGRAASSPTLKRGQRVAAAGR